MQYVTLTFWVVLGLPSFFRPAADILCSTVHLLAVATGAGLSSDRNRNSVHQFQHWTAPFSPRLRLRIFPETDIIYSNGNQTFGLLQ